MALSRLRTWPTEQPVSLDVALVREPDARGPHLLRRRHSAGFLIAKGSWRGYSLSNQMPLRIKPVGPLSERPVHRPVAAMAA